MFFWCFAIITIANVQFVFMDSAGDVIEREYFYGLSQFQDSLEAIQSEISVAEIDFLSQWKNLITIYEENLSTLSKQLFENHGFIVDAKHVYLFVLQVKNRIKDEMKRLMENFTSDNINESLTETYQSFINNLRKISEKEILKFQDPNNRNDDNMLLECWDSFKILLLDLGLNTINDLKSSSLAERENLMKNIYEVSQDASSNYDKLIDVLSKSHFKSSTPLSINTYIEENRSKILDRIGSWFQQIATSLQQANENIRLKAMNGIKEAENQFEELSREIVDCIAYD
ncbi:CLUMA_CG016198, isoform A [Clunio marinus]|uniref:CLUMA_CG016198, isoform A n=1 Tax=Clunio marinus TaxID=568069 RepID=A0A1J1IXZ5_9DIPT|nr:CLUMA_CG016198, isoform A [Clunio marinus]